MRRSSDTRDTLLVIAAMLLYFVCGGFYVYGKISQLEAELDD